MEKRNTVQKQLVLDAVAKLANHPTADAVYAEVAARHPSISKATVYRNLSSLAQDGRLRHIPMAGGADRFDHCLTEHHHIICENCGAFMDAPLTGAAALDATIELQTGYTAVTHDIVFRGCCPKCSAKRM